MPNFLDINEIDSDELKVILHRAIEIKKNLKNCVATTHFSGKHVTLVFEKPSTRTRVSFEVGVNQLGGDAIVLTSESSQLGRGEPIADTARVLSRYTDMIMLRTFRHETLIEMAKKASVPVINGLTDYSHPCQVMTDVFTFEEHKGCIGGKTIAWVGDCNNMTNSWIHAAEKFGFTLNISTPEELSPKMNSSEHVKYFSSPIDAVKNVDCVTTDTWVSMGEEDADYKRSILSNYQVNADLMSNADADAIFMHCLPAHIDEEVTSSVMEGAKSVVWDEAENRLHVQKAIMMWCLGVL